MSRKGHKKSLARILSDKGFGCTLLERDRSVAHATCGCDGYQQVSGGYIDRAKREGIVVDYKNNAPSQYWHLMTYCDSRDGKKTFSRSIVCGELIFWMAEASGVVESAILKQLSNQIIESAEHSRRDRPVYDRVKWNHIIQDVCFERIQSTIEFYFPQPL